MRSTEGAIARAAASSIGESRLITWADMLTQKGDSSVLACQSRLKLAIIADDVEVGVLPSNVSWICTVGGIGGAGGEGA